jgi:hypothetical protein
VLATRHPCGAASGRGAHRARGRGISSRQAGRRLAQQGDSAALEGATRNPAALSGTRGLMILGLGMIESVLVLVAVFLMTRM